MVINNRGSDPVYYSEGPNNAQALMGVRCELRAMRRIQHSPLNHSAAPLGICYDLHLPTFINGETKAYQIK